MGPSPPRELGYEPIVRQFFDPQLRRLGLAEDQIRQQDLDELQVSLQKVNEAIENPDSFGKLRIKVGGETGAVITQSATDYHFELGILPLLLERKGLILNRIRVLRPEQQLSELREDVVASVEDPAERERLKKTIDQRFEEQREARENLDREQAQVEAARGEAREREQRLQIEFESEGPPYITHSSNANL